MSNRLTATLLTLALVVVSAVNAQQTPIEGVVERARDAARTDRNAESARLFAEAIAKDPSRRLDLLREYADQLAYSQRAAEAVPLYRELLSTARVQGEERVRTRVGLALALSWSGHSREALQEYEALIRDHGDHLDARLGRARVLSWIDRLVESADEYQRVLAVSAENREARKGLARVRSLQGRNREAVRLLRSYLEQYPEDADAIFLLAQARHWMGRSDIAIGHLGGLPASQRSPGQVKSLIEDATRRSDDETRLSATRSTQHDELDISAAALEHDFVLERGRSALGVRYQSVVFEPRGGERITWRRPGLFLRRRFTDAAEWTGNVYYDGVEGAGTSWNKVTLDTWATLWPGDFVRVDVGVNRAPFDNIRSMTREITGRFFNGSVDWVPTDRTRVTLRASHGDYSDGNSRKLGQAEFEQRLLSRPRLLVGARYTRIDFAQQRDNGYFNPVEFESLVATVHAWGSVGPDFWWDVGGSYGLERSDGEDKPAGSGSLKVTWPATRPLAVELRYEAFDSRMGSSSGFSRNTAGAMLRYRWE